MSILDLWGVGVDAARAILKNASTEAPAVATKSVTKTGITAVGILTPTFAGSSSQQKL
jgi:ketol-acid reductoisomerase